MTSRFPPFAFVGLVSHIIKTTLHFGEKMWILCLTRSLCSLVTCCFCHWNIKFISSCHCVISSMYVCFRAFVVKPLTGTWERQSPDYHVLLCVKNLSCESREICTWSEKVEKIIKTFEKQKVSYVIINKWVQVDVQKFKMKNLIREMTMMLKKKWNYSRRLC